MTTGSVKIRSEQTKQDLTFQSGVLWPDGRPIVQV